MLMKGQSRALYALLLAALVSPIAAYAQSGTITGRVLEQGTNRPIPDANINVVGTGIGARTGENGTYRLTGVASGPIQIRATRLGYSASTRSLNIAAGATSTLDFVLSQAATQLDAVVTSAVTGQAERARESGTNVGNISVANLEKGPITKMADVLQGRVAGLTLVQY